MKPTWSTASQNIGLDKNTSVEEWLSMVHPDDKSKFPKMQKDLLDVL